jgi:hypothetical protein
MNPRDESLETEIRASKPATVARKALTAAHFEPWKGNIIDVTMLDGSHKIGLLERTEAGTARLRSVGGTNDRVTFGVIQIAEAMTVQRASRN